jgi:hypothetical protein
MVVRARTPLAHIQYFLRPGGAAERSALLPRPSLALTHLYAVACRNPRLQQLSCPNRAASRYDTHFYLFAA